MLTKLTSIKNLTRKVTTTLIAATFILSFQVNAAQKGHIKVTSKAQKIVTINKGGKKSYKFVPATKVLPGEIVQYNTYLENISNKSADGIQIVNPIPKHTVYLPHSAQGKNTRTSFSIDNGKHYAQAIKLKVKRKNGKFYPAKPSDYTHIRWQYLGTLKPKSRQTVAFRVRLN